MVETAGKGTDSKIHSRIENHITAHLNLDIYKGLLTPKLSHGSWGSGE